MLLKNSFVKLEYSVKTALIHPMRSVLPLDKMSREEKLRIMEELRADLTRDESQVESPAWHGDVLRERAEAVKSGKEVLMDWEVAKKKLRERKK